MFSNFKNIINYFLGNNGPFKNNESLENNLSKNNNDSNVNNVLKHNNSFSEINNFNEEISSPIKNKVNNDTIYKNDISNFPLFENSINKKKDKFDNNSNIILFGEIVDKRNNQIKEVKIIKTDFYYPLIRVEKFIDQNTNVIETRKMVADHILFNLPESESECSFINKLIKNYDKNNNYNFQLHGVPYAFPLFRLNFNVLSITTLPDIKEYIEVNFPNSCPEPNFVF